jgi:hypothetical protein
MSSFQQKNYKVYKEAREYKQFPWKYEIKQNCSQTIDLLGKDF